MLRDKKMEWLNKFKKCGENDEKFKLFETGENTELIGKIQIY